MSLELGRVVDWLGTCLVLMIIVDSLWNRIDRGGSVVKT